MTKIVDLEQKSRQLSGGRESRGDAPIEVPRPQRNVALTQLTTVIMINHDAQHQQPEVVLRKYVDLHERVYGYNKESPDNKVNGVVRKYCIRMANLLKPY